MADFVSIAPPASTTATLGNMLQRIRDLALTRDREKQLIAVRLAETVVALAPDAWQAHHALGRAALIAGDLPLAVRGYLMALKLRPQDTDAWVGLAMTYSRQGQDDMALEAIGHGVAANPKSPAAQVTYGDMLRIAGRPEEALAYYDRALWLKPGYHEAHYNRSFALFALGRWQEGWRGYEHRWDTEEFAPEQDVFRLKGERPQGHRWGGGPLRPGDRLLVWAEQGIGDTLWGARYLDALLGDLPDGVTVAAQVQAPVYRHMWINYRDRIQVVRRDDPTPAHTHHIPLLSLPTALGLFAPHQAPPATLRPEPGDRWPRVSAEPGQPAVVGIVWGGSGDHNNDGRRSTGLGDWQPILALAQAHPDRLRLVSLQIGPRATEAGLLFDSGLLVDPRPVIRDFADTANVLAGLDLLVGVDTGTLHLACGMRTPTWWLLGDAPDWRWAHAARQGQGEWYEPWYHTRCFHKPRGDGWADTMAAVATELSARLGLG